MRLLDIILPFLVLLSVGTFLECNAAQKSAKSTGKVPSNQQKETMPASKTKNESSNESTKQPEAMKLSKNEEIIPSRILVAYAPDSKSHLRSMLPLIDRLASDGHIVTIFYITSEKKDEKMHPSIGKIRIQLPDLKAKLEKEMGERIWKETLHSPALPIIYEKIGANFVDLVVDHSEKLASLFNSKWDLVLLDELFTIHGYAFAEILFAHHRVPYVIVSPSMMMSSAAYSNAIGHSPITHPHPFSPVPRHSTDSFEPTNLLHRIVNFLETLGDLGAAKYIDNIAVGPRLALLTGKRDFSFAKLYTNSEMSILDSIAYLAFPQPEVAEVLNAGAHCEEANELPEEYRTFVEDPKSKGTIYVAFGTFIPWNYAPLQVSSALFDVFERLSDYRIIFSFRGKFPERKLPPHIRLVSWAPQLDLLAHPKTKVFLTHCGLKSIKESLCSKTPMLAMPMFAEQNHNAYLVMKFGTGLALNKYNIDTEQLYNGLKELLDNPKYVERVDKLQRIFLDRPMPALDHGAHFVRKILKKGKAGMGRHFFDRHGIQLNFLEYFHFDLLILFTTIAAFIAWK